MSKTLQKSFIVLLVFASGFIQTACAQKSTATDTTLSIRKPHPYPNPTKAMIYSAILPGAGQLYNKKWWKVPIIYAGLGTCAYFAITNNQQYNIYHNALVQRDNGQIDQFNNIYTNNDLVSIYTYYNRYMWFSILAGTFVYILNVVDANVDAQMHGFDVSDNLSFKVTPLFNSDYITGRMGVVSGFSLVKRF